MSHLRYLKDVATLKLDTEKCTGCRMCETVCPHGVFMMENHKAVIQDIDACMECGACARNCPAYAITVKSGVGCAAAMIKGAIKKSEPTCGCGSGPDQTCC